MNLSIINVIPPNVPSSKKSNTNFTQKEIAYIENKLSIKTQNQNYTDKLDIKI